MSVTSVYELIAAGDCPLCGHTSALVAPDCTEGHGADCPDRLCLDCGSALFVDPAAGPAQRTA
jgi:DNA polymerase III alpha subunit (gram-positive type)